MPSPARRAARPEFQVALSKRIRFAIFPIALVAAISSRGIAAEGEAQFQAAREHYQRGRVEEALDVYDALEKAGGDAARIALGRSACLQAQGQYALASELLTAACAKDGKSAPLWAALAELQLAQGDFAAAATSVEAALRLDNDLPRARLALADLQAATGRLKEANEGYRWFVRYYNRVQPTDPDVLLQVAHGAAQYARWNNVTQVFDFVINTLCPDILAQDKDCWQAYLLSGTLLLEKYNRGQSLPELRRAMTINPQAADVHAALARAALQEHSLSEAEQMAGRALAINPRHVPALLVRIDLRLEVGEWSEARALCEQALETNPRDERTLARLAACDLFEDGPPPADELDELFGNLDNPSEASIERPSRFSRLVLELAGRNPHPGVFLGALGEQLESRKKYELAERCYRQAMASMPQLSGPKTALGLLFMRTGRNDDAAKILDQAFEADPYHVRVSNMRKVLNLLRGYESITTEHFVIRVDGAADRILGKYMAEFLEEQYPGLVKQFGYAPPVRTQFEIFNKAKGLSAHQWFSARMVGLPWVQTIGASTGMIVALASPTATEKPFNWARVLKHEFVHILTLQQTEFNIPHWYTEALAVESEGLARPESWNRLLLERVPAGNLMNLDNINLGFIRPKTPDDWNMAYCQSRLYAQYMTERFGPETTPRLLDAFRRNLSTERAIETVCGIDKAAFEKGYREYLDQIVGELRSGEREPPLTLAEAEKAHLAQPNDSRAAARYAYELLKINRRKDARKLAETALREHPAEPLAAVVMAKLALRAEDLPAAVAVLEPALDRAQPHPRVLELLAEIKQKQERFSEAADLYELGLSRDPDHVAWLKGLARALLSDQKETARLKAVLEKLVRADADDPGVPRRLARMALSGKDFAEAIRYGKMSLYVDVLDVDTHRILAQAFAGLGQFPKAIEEWSVAAELKPDDPALIVDLARAERAAGRNEAAIARLKTLLEQKPDVTEAKKLLDEWQ
jgi:tetratricopeptide (TPR) repeat protein